MVGMKPVNNVFRFKNITWSFTMVSIELRILFKLNKVKETFVCNLITQNCLHKEGSHESIQFMRSEKLLLTVLTGFVHIISVNFQMKFL